MVVRSIMRVEGGDRVDIALVIWRCCGDGRCSKVGLLQLWQLDAFSAAFMELSQSFVRTSLSRLSDSRCRRYLREKISANEEISTLTTILFACTSIPQMSQEACEVFFEKKNLFFVEFWRLRNFLSHRSQTVPKLGLKTDLAAWVDNTSTLIPSGDHLDCTAWIQDINICKIDSRDRPPDFLAYELRILLECGSLRHVTLRIHETSDIKLWDEIGHTLGLVAKVCKE